MGLKFFYECKCHGNASDRGARIRETNNLNLFKCSPCSLTLFALQPAAAVCCCGNWHTCTGIICKLYLYIYSAYHNKKVWGTARGVGDVGGVLEMSSRKESVIVSSNVI